MAISRFDSSLTVHDPFLAGALFAFGILPDPRGFEERFRTEDGRNRHCWHFLPQSRDGLFTAREIIEGWKDQEEFNRKFPQHPLAYLMMSLKNGNGLREHCANRTPKFVVSRGPSVAVIDPSDRKTSEDLLAKIGI